MGLATVDWWPTTVCNHGTCSNTTDCDDGNSSVNPNGIEVCNGLDDDCDGDFDAGVLGMDEMCAADSCLDILLPSDIRRWYYIDFSGSGLAE